MKIEILEAFRGYPDGKTERFFKVGQVVDDLPDDYADVAIEKKLARRMDGAATKSSAVETEGAA